MSRISQKIILPVRPALQKTDNDCGPAALHTILGTLDHKINYPTLLRLAKTDRAGTRPQNLARALRALKVRHQITEHASLKLLTDKIAARNLCIVDYQAWANGGADSEHEAAGHYSVVYGFNKTHLFVADPSKLRVRDSARRGLRTIRKDLFVKRWHDRGPAGKTFHWLLCVPLPPSIDKNKK